MEAKDIRQMDLKEIGSKVKELRMNLLKLRIEASSSQIKNPLRKRHLRRDIARLLTIAGEKINATKTK
ncbi:MAG: 50S ribosomal protein L29 [Candidatus Margulisiibacteriota bacterium]